MYILAGFMFILSTAHKKRQQHKII